MQYHFVILLSRIICLLPESLRNKIGDLIGALCWPLVPRKRREMAVANAMAALGVGRREAEEIVKRSAVRFGRMFLEVLYMPKITKANIRQRVTIKGSEHLDAALAQGRGVVLATAHSGNWEILGAALAMHGYPIVAVVQKQTNAAMDKFINEYRTLAGMHVTYKTGVREMISLLDENKIIGLLMDQDAGGQGIFVDFFGRPASAPKGPAVLARRKGALVVPAFITATGHGTHIALVHPPLEVDHTADREQDIFTATGRLTAIVENHIRQYPHEWFWLHNRWKTPPPDGQEKK